ncbi:MAG: hypothetical protein FJZ01_00535 [Candidatus Sericytochromatia bacterium]|nr:hypothetical protein [Candidatus Tanganyikabacteria bacterium]
MSDITDIFAADSRLGQILIRRGVVTPAELEDALRVQEAQPERQLGEILVAQHSATPSQIREALRDQLADARLGQILVRIGAVKPEHLGEALDLQADRGGLLGEILVELEFSTKEQIAWALSQQNAEKRFGSFLLRRRLIAPEQLDQAMRLLGKRPDALLSEILVEEGYLTLEQVQENLRFQLQEARLGQILIKQGSLTEGQLEQALIRQGATGQLLGEILVATGLCTLEQIGRALEEQMATTSES